MQRSRVTTAALANIGTLITCASINVVTVLLTISMFLVGGAIVVNVSIHGSRVRVVGCVNTASFFMHSPFMVRNVLVKLVNSLLPLNLVCILCGGFVSCIVVRFPSLAKLVRFLPISRVCQALLPIYLKLNTKVNFLKDFVAIHGRLHM